MVQIIEANPQRESEFRCLLVGMQNRNVSITVKVSRAFIFVEIRCW